jgi:hypothetical protein
MKGSLRCGDTTKRTETGIAAACVEKEAGWATGTAELHRGLKTRTGASRDRLDGWKDVSPRWNIRLME